MRRILLCKRPYFLPLTQNSICVAPSSDAAHGILLPREAKKRERKQKRGTLQNQLLRTARVSCCRRRKKCLGDRVKTTQSTLFGCQSNAERVRQVSANHRHQFKKFKLKFPGLMLLVMNFFMLNIFIIKRTKYTLETFKIM
jgi:hypothetical protein